MDLLIYALLILIIILVLIFAFAEAKAHKGNAEGEKDFLLILGCRVRGDEAEETLRMRSEKAAEYLREHQNTIAIACGGIVHKDQNKSEAQAILEILTEKGIDGSRVILEDKSQTTVQNFIYAGKIIDGLALSHTPSLAFLSSEFHLLRAGVIAKRCGVTAECIAAPSPKKEIAKNYIREFFAFPLLYIGGNK